MYAETLSKDLLIATWTLSFNDYHLVGSSGANEGQRDNEASNALRKGTEEADNKIIQKRRKSLRRGLQSKR